MSNTNYYYGKELRSFAFYRLPKVLFSDDRYATLRAEAKLLYGIIFDRMEFSVKNEMIDEQGRVYIYLTIDEASKRLGYGHDKISRLFSELEKADLIERKRQGLCKASKIYPKRFFLAAKSDVRNADTAASGELVFDVQEAAYSDANNTEINNTKVSDTYLSINVDEIEDRIKEQVEYDVLLDKGEDQAKVDEIMSIMAEVMIMRNSTIRIGGTDYPAEFVRQRLATLTNEHIECVLDTMRRVNKPIHNIKGYMLAMLFNAAATFEHFIQSEVNSGFAS